MNVERIFDESGRGAALRVLSATYQREKAWIAELESQFPYADLQRPDVVWFLARVNGEPVGVLRTLYDPPLLQYAQYRLQMLVHIDVGQFLRPHLIAEVGRFAVLAEHRGKLLLAIALMRASIEDITARGHTHIITDVFEDDVHSPLGFHTRVLGFVAAATHERGELNCASRRITLMLDFKSSYQRLKARRSWVYRYLTAHWSETLHHRFA